METESRIVGLAMAGINARPINEAVGNYVPLIAVCFKCKMPEGHFPMRQKSTGATVYLCHNCKKNWKQNKARRERHQAMLDVGMVRVRGAQGGVYYE